MNLQRLAYPLSFLAICATTPALSETKPVVFKVSEVPIADQPLATRPANEILRRPSADEFESAAHLPGENWVSSETRIRHPFIAAAHLAFAEHRPLALSPDMIWLLLTQLAAAEVQDQPEKYRELFAAHERGRRTLSVRRDHFVANDPANDWPGVFAELEAQIVRNVPSSPAADFSHRFSGTTRAEIAARRVVLLNAASSFYDFHVSTMCGIPRIELHGSVDDWRWIRTHLGNFRKLGMNRRVDALFPVIEQFIHAADGREDPAFWRSFYKYQSESGSSYVSGWINLFFIGESEKTLDLILDGKFKWSDAPVIHSSLGARNLPLALRTTAFTGDGTVNVEFVWDYLQENQSMRLCAGFMGIAQDPKTLTLKPSIAWQVTRLKKSSEERMALEFLGGLRSLGYFEIAAIRNDFVFDSMTGSIKVARGARSDTIDSGFWRKAFPLMTRLETIHVGSFSDSFEEEADFEAMLGAPFVKKVVVPGLLDEKCLQILRSRTDWKIETEKKQ